MRTVYPNRSGVPVQLFARPFLGLCVNTTRPSSALTVAVMSSRCGGVGLLSYTSTHAAISLSAGNSRSADGAPGQHAAERIEAGLRRRIHRSIGGRGERDAAHRQRRLREVGHVEIEMRAALFRLGAVLRRDAQLVAARAAPTDGAEPARRSAETRACVSGRRFRSTSGRSANTDLPSLLKTPIDSDSLLLNVPPLLRERQILAEGLDQHFDVGRSCRALFRRSP